MEGGGDSGDFEAYHYRFDAVGALLHRAAASPQCGGFGNWCCVCTGAREIITRCLRIAPAPASRSPSPSSSHRTPLVVDDELTGDEKGRGRILRDRGDSEGEGGGRGGDDDCTDVLSDIDRVSWLLRTKCCVTESENSNSDADADGDSDRDGVSGGNRTRDGGDVADDAHPWEEDASAQGPPPPRVAPVETLRTLGGHCVDGAGREAVLNWSAPSSSFPGPEEGECVTIAHFKGGGVRRNDDLVYIDTGEREGSTLDKSGDEGEGFVVHVAVEDGGPEARAPFTEPAPSRGDWLTSLANAKALVGIDRFNVVPAGASPFLGLDGLRGHTNTDSNTALNTNTNNDGSEVTEARPSLALDRPLQGMGPSHSNHPLSLVSIFLLILPLMVLLQVMLRGWGSTFDGVAADVEEVEEEEEEEGSYPPTGSSHKLQNTS